MKLDDSSSNGRGKQRREREAVNFTTIHHLLCVPRPFLLLPLPIRVHLNSPSFVALFSNPMFYEPTSVVDPHLTSSPADTAFFPSFVPYLSSSDFTLIDSPRTPSPSPSMFAPTSSSSPLPSSPDLRLSPPPPPPPIPPSSTSPWDPISFFATAPSSTLTFPSPPLPPPPSTLSCSHLDVLIRSRPPRLPQVTLSFFAINDFSLLDLDFDFDLLFSLELRQFPPRNPPRRHLYRVQRPPLCPPPSPSPPPLPPLAVMYGDCRQKIWPEHRSPCYDDANIDFATLEHIIKGLPSLHLSLALRKRWDSI